MENSDVVSAEQAKELTDELCALSKRQTEAVHTGTYIKMTDDELKQYDKRAMRISEICKLLGRFQEPESTGSR